MLYLTPAEEKTLNTELLLTFGCASEALFSRQWLMGEQKPWKVPKASKKANFKPELQTHSGFRESAGERWEGGTPEMLPGSRQLSVSHIQSGHTAQSSLVQCLCFSVRPV